MMRIEIESVGRGRDLALIHGWGIGPSAWTALLPLLTPHLRVHLVALPGYGAARHPPSALPSAPDFCASAESLVNSLPAGCTLCGWSLGALLALQAVVQEAPAASPRSAGLILCAATPAFTQRADWAHAQPPALLESFRQALASDAAGTLQRFIALQGQGDSQARANSRRLAQALIADGLPDAATLLRGLDWLGAVDLRARLTDLAPKLPTLIVHGENDPLMPLAAAHWLKRTLPQSQLEIFAGAAHAPFINDPERFARLIFDFCDVPTRN